MRLHSLRSPSAQAAAPLAGKQTAGWYRYKVGNHEVTVVTDGQNTFPLPDTFVTNMKKDDVNVALATAYMEKDKMTIPYSPVVVNTGSKLVAIDTGTGEANFERSKGVGGQYHANLKAAGIDRNAVDIVLISHFHGDHINGLLTPDNKPAFANAEILVPAPEWKYFMDDGEMSRQTTERMKGVFSNARRVFDALGRKVTPYESGKEVAPGITSVATHGHTPDTCRTSSPPAPARSTCRPTSPIIRRCSCAIRAGTRSSTRTARWPRRPAARSTTCWSPRSCWCKASTIRSRTCSRREERIGLSEIPVPWNPVL